MIRRPADKPGVRVGVVGASSLLGQEILHVLKDRNFPVAQLSKFESEAEDPDLPVLDLSGEGEFAEAETEAGRGELDLLFLAARPQSKAGESDLLGKALEAAGMSADSPAPASCLIIDAAAALGDVPGRNYFIPSAGKLSIKPSHISPATIAASPHPVAIVLTRVLLRLAARFPIKDCVAQVFFPASELGPRGIEELQKQTVNLLSFQRFPQKVFGAQLAFNLLPRLPGKHAAGLAKVESAIRSELRECLGGAVPAPALHFCHAPVFYSLALSIFVELKGSPAREDLIAALSGNGITVRASSEAPPNPVEAAGSGEILLDGLTHDPGRPGGYWIWAAVDNIRLAAENAVDIALNHLHHMHPKQ